MYRIGILALVTSACANDALVGDWEGDIDCGEFGSLDVELAIETEDQDYLALGLVSGLENDAKDPIDLNLELDIYQPHPAGPQTLEIEANCTLSANGETLSLDCSDFDELGWDGRDAIEAEISGFLGTPDWVCSMDLER